MALSLMVSALALFGVGTSPALVLGETPASACMAAAASITVTHHDVATCQEAAEDRRQSRADRTASLVNLGIVLRKSARLTEALSAYDRAEALSPDFAEVYLNRSAVLVELGRNEEALVDVNRALELGPLQPHVAYYNRSLIHERRGELVLAWRDLREAVRIKPDYTAAHAALARYQVSPSEGAGG